MSPTRANASPQILKSGSQDTQAGLCKDIQSCVPHRLARRKFIGQEGPLDVGNYFIQPTPPADGDGPAIESDQAADDIPTQAFKFQTSASIMKWDVKSPFHASSSDKIAAPTSKPTSTRSPLTKRSSMFSLRSLMGTITPASTRTWAGSHFEIGADIEEVLKQTSLIPDHERTTTPPRRASELPRLPRPASLSTPVRQPTRLRQSSSFGTPPASAPARSELVAQQSPTRPTVRQSPQPCSRTSLPQNRSPKVVALPPLGAYPRSAEGGPSSQTVKFIPQARVSTLRGSKSHSNVSPPVQSSSHAPDFANPFKATLLDQPISTTSIMEVRMLVKFQWADQSPERLSNRTGPRIRGAEEPFKPYKVVFSDRVLQLYQCSKSLFHRGEGSWKLVHSIQLEKGETQFSRPFSSELAFCLTVNIKRGSTRSFHSKTSVPGKPEQAQAKPSCASRAFYTSRQGLSKPRIHAHSRATLAPKKASGRVAHFIFIACTKSMGDVLAHQLWQRVGGRTPKDVLVDVIGVSSNVRVSITRNREGETVYLSEAELRQATIHCLTSHEDYAAIYAQLETKGRDLKLAWRRGDRLDWITPVEHHIVFGTLNQQQLQLSSIMRGLATQRVKNEAVLEIRPALHYPNFVTLANGSIGEEPSGLEGFVNCLGPVPKKVYLSTFDGILFICKPTLAVPPRAPISEEERKHLLEQLRSHSGTDGCGSFIESTRLSQPATTTHIGSTCVQATNLSPGGGTQTSSQAQKLNVVDENVATTQTSSQSQDTSDNDKVAQDALLIQFYGSESSRQKQLVRNSYQLIYMSDIECASVLSAEVVWLHKPSLFHSKKPRPEPSEEGPSGFQIQVGKSTLIKFEVGSRAEADQWVEQLSVLSRYWKQRTREDAQVEMLAQPRKIKAEASHTPGLMQPSRAMSESDLTSSEEFKISILSSLYHRCVVEGCRTITRVGKLNVQPCRGSLWHGREVVLCGGQLIEYRKVEYGWWERRAGHTELRKKLNVFGLESSYVCTGEAFADRMPGGATVPGVYEDGLRTSDPGSDCVFVVWMGVNSQAPDGKSASHFSRLYRARSKLERDLWIHAIQFEIERAVASSHHDGAKSDA